MRAQRVAQRVAPPSKLPGSANPRAHFTFAQPSTAFLSCLSTSSSTQV